MLSRGRGQLIGVNMATSKQVFTDNFDLIVSRVSKGDRAKTIADDLGINIRTFQDLSSSFKVKSLSLSTLERVKKNRVSIGQMRRYGHEWKEIARKLCISDSALLKARKQLNIK